MDPIIWGCLLALLDPVTSNWTHSPNRTTHTCAIWSLKSLRRVNGRARLVEAHVGISTGNILAWEAWETREIVIKSIQPHCTVVSCQTPFSNKNRTKFALHGCNFALLCARITEKGEARLWVLPSLIDVCVNGTIRATIHEPTPNISIESKTIVHNIFPVRGIPLHNEVSLPIKVLKFFNWSMLPRLVHRLQTQNRGMATVKLGNSFQNIKGMLNLFPVDFRVFESAHIKFTHPACISNRPVLERCQTSRINVN
mmetsp:Transcript_31517/g.94298  ORF Transcript_31517/g.94298 Transcript_31517/m.94298 type:complete len:254 (+) Transcript_31517:1410-2171(+)